METSLVAFGRTLRKLCNYCIRALFRNNTPLKLILPIEMFLSILEFSRHKLRIAHGLTLVSPSLCGWETFPMPRALTHTRITWAPSLTVPHSRVSLRFSLYTHGGLGIPNGQVRDRLWTKMELETIQLKLKLSWNGICLMMLGNCIHFQGYAIILK